MLWQPAALSCRALLRTAECLLSVSRKAAFILSRSNTPGYELLRTSRVDTASTTNSPKDSSAAGGISLVPPMGGMIDPATWTLESSERPRQFSGLSGTLFTA